MNSIKFVIWFAGDFMYRGRVIHETHDSIHLEVQDSLSFPGIVPTWSYSGYCWIPKSALLDQKDGFAELKDANTVRFSNF